MVGNIFAMKNLNFDMHAAGEKRLLQLNEMDEFRNAAYENARIYKARTKYWHEKYILRCEFQKFLMIQRAHLRLIVID